MAALLSWTDFLTRYQGADNRVLISKGSINGGNVQRPSSAWLASPLAGAAPTTAAVPTRATTGSHPFDLWNNTAGAFETRCLGGNLAQTGPAIPASAVSMFLLVDRLSHQGGLSGTTTGVQATNLPTAALTRFTSGAGVMAALEIYTAVGSTASTAVLSYTNQAGTSGRTSPAVTFGGSGFSTANRFIPIPLAAGDTGVQAVASVTLGASTLTAGNFGVTLFKPITMFAVAPRLEAVDPFIAGNQVGVVAIPDDACLQFVVIPGSANTTNFIGGDLALAQV